ncbi:hypothetical protein CGRA01v4_00983 [Colletotrichum graminicola]|nr:hypothetical protein CGRA01v4_00983 [Colletotrichum graminicola]
MPSISTRFRNGVMRSSAGYLQIMLRQRPRVGSIPSKKLPARV